jgi:hypothetical protein
VLILDLADDLLEHVLQGADPENGTLALAHDGQMAPPAPELAQGVHHGQVGADEGHRADRVLEDHDPLAGIHVKEILRVEDADDSIERALVDRDARVARVAHVVHQVLGRDAALDGEDLLAGDHHVADPGPRETEDVAEDPARVGPDLSRLPRLGDQERELLGRVDRVGLTRGRDAQHPDEPVSGAVHHHEHEVEDASEDQQGRRAQQRGRARPVEGDRLWRQLAHHDVEEGDDREGERDRDGVDG